MNVMWTDSHCHLDRMDHDPVPDAVRGGVGRFLIPGVTGLSEDAIRLAQTYETVFLAVGTHPLYREGASDDPAALIRQAVSGKGADRVAAVGEVGLDYWQPPVNRQGQLVAFAEQLEAAAQLNVPVLIHLRKAFDDFVAVVQGYRELCFVMHMYSGSAEQAVTLLRLLPRVYFSFGAPVLRENARRKQRTLAAIPLERLLLETDSPDLPPPGVTPPNSPVYLPDIGTGIADRMGIAPEALARQTSQNAAEVFGWTLPSSDWES